MIRHYYNYEGFFVFVDIVHTLFVIELRALLLANSLIRLLLQAGLTADLEERNLGHAKSRAALESWKEEQDSF